MTPGFCWVALQNFLWLRRHVTSREATTSRDSRLKILHQTLYTTYISENSQHHKTWVLSRSP